MGGTKATDVWLLSQYIYNIFESKSKYLWCTLFHSISLSWNVCSDIIHTSSTLYLLLLCLHVAIVSSKVNQKGFLAILITCRWATKRLSLSSARNVAAILGSFNLLKLFSASIYIYIKQDIYHLILGELCCQIFVHLSNVKNFSLVFQLWPSWALLSFNASSGLIVASRFASPTPQITHGIAWAW